MKGKMIIHVLIHNFSKLTETLTKISLFINGALKIKLIFRTSLKKPFSCTKVY